MHACVHLFNSRHLLLKIKIRSRMSCKALKQFNRPQTLATAFFYHVSIQKSCLQSQKVESQDVGMFLFLSEFFRWRAVYDA